MSKLLEAYAVLGIYEGDKIDVEGSWRNPYTLTENGLENCVGNIGKSYLTELLLGDYKFTIRPKKGGS